MMEPQENNLRRDERAGVQTASVEDVSGRKVLAIDDNPTNLALLKVHLKKMALTPLLAESGPSGLEVARTERPDLILLDVMMPEVDGYEVCVRLKEDILTRDIPVIFISAKDQASDKVRGLELGGVDYISKPFDAGELRARIQIILQMIGLQERLLCQANTDELTRLANRRYFMEIMQREMAELHSQINHLSLLMVDLDHFKQINDTYGHLAGDHALRELSRLLSGHIQQMDLAGRYGGEEFTVLMPKADSEAAFNSAERLRRRIVDHDWRFGEETIPITASIGVATIDSFSSVSQKAFVDRADMALYTAKRGGRNRVVRYCELEGAANAEVSFPCEASITRVESIILDMALQMRERIIRGVMSLANTIGVKHSYLLYHSDHVRQYSQALAERLGLDESFRRQLDTAARLHDIGKLGIPAAVLNHEGPLSDEQWDIFKRHSVIGIRLVDSLGLSTAELRIIRSHHEWYDGHGYPDGLAGNKIPFGARVLAVADSFDAMTCNDQYRAILSVAEALEEIRKGAGTRYDPEVAGAFIEVAEEHRDEWPLRMDAGQEPVDDLSELFCLEEIEKLTAEINGA